MSSKYEKLLAAVTEDLEAIPKNNLDDNLRADIKLINEYSLTESTTNIDKLFRFATLKRIQADLLRHRLKLIEDL